MINRIVIKGFRALRNFDWVPDESLNIIVGDNGSGKSTILDAIELAMRGRLMGSRASEALDPHWFNQDVVAEFYDSLDSETTGSTPPEILIELYFSKERGDIAQLQGTNNSHREDLPGIALKIAVNQELEPEFFATVREDNHQQKLLPVEYYKVNWETFAGISLGKALEPITCFRIDSNPTRSSSSTDYYARNTVDAHLNDEEKRDIALRYRGLKQSIDDEILNGLIKDDEDILDDITFRMDQSLRADWRNSVTIYKDSLPLSNAGKGLQVEARTRLALKKAETKKVLLMEEPENHLSHTSLNRLLGLIENNLQDRQLFITTHNAFVLNRLGLDKLTLVCNGESPTYINDLSKDTVGYFQRQSGIDTLRIVLGNKVVLVEGPSDEMIFNWAFEQKYSNIPQKVGIDVIAYGVRGKRALELSAALKKVPVVVIRDNDGKEPGHWISAAESFLNDGRQMFIGEDPELKTLEPQMIEANKDNLPALAKAIGFSEANINESNLLEYMLTNKTDWAWTFVSTTDPKISDLQIPSYIVDAVTFIEEFGDE